MQARSTAATVPAASPANTQFRVMAMKEACRLDAPGPQWGEPRISPQIAPASGMLAQYRRAWRLLWSESHSGGYGLSEEQVQACMDQPGHG